MTEDLMPGVLLINIRSSLEEPDLKIVVSREWVLEENPNLRREEVERKIPVKQLGVDESLFHVDPRSIRLLDNLDHHLVMDDIENIRLFYQSFQSNKTFKPGKIFKLRSEFGLFVLFLVCNGNTALIPPKEREAYQFYFNQLQKALNTKAAAA